MPSRAASDSRSLKWCLWTTATLLILASRPELAAAQDLWGELHLPGGARHGRAAFSLGLPEDRPDGAWLFDYLVREFKDSKVLGRVSFEQYALTLERARVVLAQWPDGLVLPRAEASESERRRTEDAVRTLGLRLRARGNQYQVEADRSDDASQRTAALEAAGLDIAEIALTLNAGRPARIPIPSSGLPLPLPEYWTKYVFARDVPPVLSIVRSRPDSLLYLGLLTQDEPTLAFLRARPDLVRRLRDEASAPFAAFGRSLRVRDGVIDLPGGEDAVDVWRELVGRHPEEADRFILSLFTRDSGRLAYFYDTVAQLAPARQRFALGSGLDTANRVRFVRRMAAHFAASHPQWDIDQAPFYRPPFDPAVVLTFVDIRQDGTFGPPWLPALLTRVMQIDAWPTRPDRVFGSLPDEYPHALWMMDWIFGKPIEAPTRFGLLRFAQRVFGHVARESVTDVGLALLSVKDMPALPKALERMSVVDPALYRATAVAAYNLTLSGGADDVTPVLARWQAALGLLEQTQRWRRLPEQALRPLLESLVKLTPVDRRRAPGASAAWVVDHLLPHLVPEGAPEDLEPRALRAFTRSAAHAPVRFSWEGLPYAADVSENVFRSAWALRQPTPQQPNLTDLVRLHAVRRVIEGVATLDDVGRASAALRSLDATLGWLPAQGERGARLLRDLRDAAAQLDRIRDVRNVSRVQRALEPLLEGIDLVTDLTIPPLVYALAVAPTREPVALYVETWRAHSLQPPDSQTFGSWRQTAWQSPEVDTRPEGGLMLRGAMLSVDVVLAEALLMRAMPSHPVRSRYLLNVERDTLLRYLAYAHTETLEQDPAVDALEASRALVARWAVEIPSPRALQDSLRSAGVDGWRANALAWDAHRVEMSVGEWLTPLELLDLRPAGRAGLAWHGPSPPADGCHCLRSLDVQSPEALRGRESGVLIALVPNLPLRLAERLIELELPRSLLPALLPMAVQDWIDAANQSGPDDWESSAGWLRRLSRERVEDYLLSLIAAGIIVAPGQPSTALAP